MNPWKARWCSASHGERYLYLHGTVLHGVQPGASGVLAVLHDITELKKLETIRRDFVASVSHELRTPVTSIKGFVETLLDGAMHNPEELDRFLHRGHANRSPQRHHRGPADAGPRRAWGRNRPRSYSRSARCGSVLEAALTTCGRKAAEKKVALELTCPAELATAMNGPLLEQAVVNLIDNAVKYSTAEQNIAVEALQEGEEMLIRVTDHGCGIGAEHLTRIFERFYRADKARSRDLGGTGLGLAIVKHIAHSHGGRVAVHSTLGQGSTFTIYLPCPQVEPAPLALSARPWLPYPAQAAHFSARETAANPRHSATPVRPPEIGPVQA